MRKYYILKIWYLYFFKALTCCNILCFFVKDFYQIQFFNEKSNILRRKKGKKILPASKSCIKQEWRHQSNVQRGCLSDLMVDFAQIPLPSCIFYIFVFLHKPLLTNTCWSVRITLKIVFKKKKTQSNSAHIMKVTSCL